MTEQWPTPTPEEVSARDLVNARLAGIERRLQELEDRNERYLQRAETILKLVKDGDSRVQS